MKTETATALPSITAGTRRVAPQLALPGAAPSTPPASTATVAAAPQKKVSEMNLEELREYAAGLEAKKSKGGGGLQFGRAAQRVTWSKTEGRAEKVVAATATSAGYTSKAKPACFGLALQPANRGNALQLDVGPSGGLSIKGAGQRGVHGSAGCFLGLISNPVEVFEFFVRNRDISIEQGIEAAIMAESGKPTPKDVEVIRNTVIKAYDGALDDAQNRLVELGLIPAPVAAPAV